jgi:murein DD-endopeptidase MepM/ murein hydrolase activator NlpD
MRWRIIVVVMAVGLALGVGSLLRMAAPGASDVRASADVSTPTSMPGPTLAAPTLTPEPTLATPTSTPEPTAAITTAMQCQAPPTVLPCETEDDETAETGWQWPIRNTRMSQGYGVKHPGWDLSGQIGQAVFAAARGKVAFAGWNNAGYGNLVIVGHSGGLQTWYAHLQYIVVTASQTVNAGDQLGTMGGSGNAEGWHLHFEVRVNGVPQAPERYLIAGVKP